MKKIILATSILATAILSSAQQTIDLFNGKDLSNWKFYLEDSTTKPEEVFSVKEGLIHIKGTPFGYMYTKEKYGNYKLHVEYRWPNGKLLKISGFMWNGVIRLKKPIAESLCLSKSQQKYGPTQLNANFALGKQETLFYWVALI